MVAPQPFFRPRGTPFSVLHRIRALLEAGHKVDLLTYPFGENIDLPGLRIMRSRRPHLIHDVKIGPSLAKVLLDIPLYLQTARALRTDHYDVLHSHEEAAFFGVHLARRYAVRHIYDMHSSLPHQLRNFRAYDLGLFRSLFQRLEERVLQTCDGVITICAELANIAEKHSGTTPHVMIENTADDTKVFGKQSEDVRRTFSLNDKRVVLYTGTFEPYQGLDILLLAFARVQERHSGVHLVLVGGRPEQVERYRDIARALGFAQLVTFVGSVHPSRIPAFLEIADVIVSPRSHGEYTPLKIYNYLRSRRPLIATDLPTHTQTLDSSVAHLVPPTVEGLATGMQRILDDPVYGQQLAEAAALRAEREFSDNAYLAKVAAFYKQVVKGPQRSGTDLPATAHS